ncbi:hypothetical protein GUJ93_ZPchr0006g40634 [Zizania palustris]|uniref:Uncharacterized protein n=1 Tax=Zizania palustris TaxID=103762 RepID=A0A8J5W2E5_ZIZPA|nr:hypothetical protein GUJ93_ZPchr0006g40634 [Zizania palustris]
MNHAIFQTSSGAIDRKLKKSDMVKPKPSSYVRRLTRFAGTLSGTRDYPEPEYVQTCIAQYETMKVAIVH